MKLYNGLSPNGARVGIFLAEKGIELPTVEIDVMKGETQTPTFLKINSLGQVPVLELDDGTIITESVAICWYLESLHAEPALFGRDAKEQARIVGTFENLWPDKNADPTAAFIGCPHNTYHEVIKWGKLVTEALDKAGKKEAAIPVYMFTPNPVRDRLIEEEGELAGKMKQAGMHATNMCGLTYAGMKGFSERVRGVTNSAKTRNYTSLRYFPDEILVQIIVTGKIPRSA